MNAQLLSCLLVYFHQVELKVGYKKFDNTKIKFAFSRFFVYNVI